ncbi:hypothetical protein Pcinc_027534, partial [Petrolisthes cinctipes]
PSTSLSSIPDTCPTSSSLSPTPPTDLLSITSTILPPLHHPHDPPPSLQHLPHQPTSSPSPLPTFSSLQHSPPTSSSLQHSPPTSSSLQHSPPTSSSLQHSPPTSCSLQHPTNLLFSPTLPTNLLFSPTLPTNLLFSPTLPTNLLFSPTLPTNFLLIIIQYVYQPPPLIPNSSTKPLQYSPHLHPSSSSPPPPNLSNTTPSPPSPALQLLLFSSCTNLLFSSTPKPDPTNYNFNPQRCLGVAGTRIQRDFMRTPTHQLTH